MGMEEHCPPPSMSLLLPSPWARTVNLAEMGEVLVGTPGQTGEKSRFWTNQDWRGDKVVELGDLVKAGWLPTKYLLTLATHKVGELEGAPSGFLCPCGTRRQDNGAE